MKNIKILFFLILLLGISDVLTAQDWDYQKYPKHNITLQHLNASIHIDESGLIEGDILYRAIATIHEPDSLVFDASRLDILSVFVNESETPFSVLGEQLTIYPEEAYEKDSVLNVRIQYEANPRFGLLRDVNHTTWTSQLPKTTRHWLPVKDHPRSEFTTEFVFTHPSGNMMITNGRRVGSEVVSVEEEQTTFTSNIPVPATSLAWALGEFSQHSSISVERFQGSGASASVRVQAYTETSLSTDPNFSGVAATAIEMLQNELETVFPYRDLNIIVLDDNFWETKSYAAGVIFVYREDGNIVQQIRRGVLSQWIGTHIREEQWSDAEAILTLQAILVNQNFQFSPVFGDADEPYDRFSSHNYSRWELFYRDNELPRFKHSLQRSLSTILEGDQKILSWNGLSEIIYEESGQPFFDGFDPEQAEIAVEDSILYTATMDWNETDNTVQINFNAENRIVDELVSVTVEEINFQETNQREITFTGQSDSSVIRVSPGVENVKLTLVGRDDIILDVQKPFMFWVNQLRNDMDAVDRAEAASGLASYTDNPDLQLAMDDILRVESNPEVYAEIVRSLAVITDGASGMDQRFLEYSTTQQHTEVRIAAAEALADFPGNEQVISRLRGIVVQSNNKRLKETAIRSLAAVTEADRFNTITEDLISREPVLHQVPILLELLAEKGEAESAVEMAGTFISEQFPYDVRNQALEIMLSYDRSSSNWEDRLPELLTDIHPGIRYKAATALQYLNIGARVTLSDQFLTEEYDERVRRVLRNFQ